MKATNTHSKSKIVNKRWPADLVIREARIRTRKIKASATRDVAAMLADLVKEAGWSEADFIDALCKDIISLNS